VLDQSPQLLSSAERQLLDAGLVPLGVVPHEAYFAQTRCQECLRSQFISANQLLNQKTGCSFCFINETENAHSYFYCVINDDLQAIKVGVGKMKERGEERLAVLAKNGWRIVSVWYYDSYRDALRLEAIVIFILRNKLNLLQHLQKNQIPGGWTETFDLISCPIELLQELIEKIDLQSPASQRPTRKYSTLKY
jgi:hypothetical protein